MKLFKYILPVVALSLGSCAKDYLDVTPTEKVSDKALAASPGSSASLVNGVHNLIYLNLWGQPYGAGQHSLNFLYDALGDDYFNSNSAFHMGIYRWEDHRDPNGDINSFTWTFYYKAILNINKALVAVESESDSALKERLQGELYALRAWAYHYLVQLYGKRYVAGAANETLGVILRTDGEDFEPKERATVAETYKLIDEDITKALELLKDKPNTGQKHRIQYATACGIAARIALTKADYAKAEEYAQLAIAGSGATLQSGDALLDGFNNLGASEWIWGYHQNSEQNTYYTSFGASFSYNFVGHNRSMRFSVNRTIYNKTNPTDVRRKWFVCQDLKDVIPADANPAYFNPANWEVSGQSIKFKTPSATASPMDAVMMRLGELYYIQAEAEARQGKYAEAQATLFAVMSTRDPAYQQSSSTGEALIEEIMNNKRMDLWGEGLRFFDMKRLGIVPNRSEANIANYAIIKTVAGDVAYNRAIQRNSGSFAEMIPTSVDTDAWQFVIPLKEIEAAQGKVIQNPL